MGICKHCSRDKHTQWTVIHNPRLRFVCKGRGICTQDLLFIRVCYLDLLSTPEALFKSSVLKFTVIYDTNIKQVILTRLWLRTTWSVIKTPIWGAGHISQCGRWRQRKIVSGCSLTLEWNTHFISSYTVCIKVMKHFDEFLTYIVDYVWCTISLCLYQV